MIYEFLWFSFCDWYIEFSKQAQIAEEQKQILFYILENSLRILQPIMPFITEEIWQALNAKYKFSSQEHLLNVEFPKQNKKMIFTLSQANDVEYLISIIRSVRNTRQSLGISWQDQIEILFNSENDNEKYTILNNIDILKNVL